MQDDGFRRSSNGGACRVIELHSTRRADNAALTSEPITFAVLSTNIRPGAEILVRVEGSDEGEAMAAVMACLESLSD